MDGLIVNKKKHLGVFHVIMINIIAVDSIRTLPFAASLGTSLIFYYFLIGITFFLPTALVCAELGTSYPFLGGMYVWVREAFGKKVGLLAIWLNWIYNIVWYPTIIALMAGTATYLFDPSYQDNKIYMAVSVILIFWIATILNFFGIKTSSIVSVLGAIIGVLLPMFLIILISIYWIANKQPMAVSFDKIIPEFTLRTSNLGVLSNILFGLMGLEMVASHGSEIDDPKKNYPKAILISAIIILASIVLSSLAITVIVPAADLSLSTGVIQAFSMFLSRLGLSWATPVVAFFIIIGGLCGVSAWIIGPSKGIMMASKDGTLPKILSKTNRFDVPVNVLLFQAIIVTVLSLSFIIFFSVNSSFWILSAITAQVAVLVYIFLFFSIVKLRKISKKEDKVFRIPGGRSVLKFVSIIGSLSCVIVFFLGFIPPDFLGDEKIVFYELFLLLGTLSICCIPFLFLKFITKK